MRGSSLSTLVDGYRRARRAAAVVGLAAITFTGALGATAQAESFGGGGRVGGDAYKYAAAPHAVTHEDTLYEYATGKDGKGYYTTLDGEEWSPWQGWADQPADFQWQPTAVDAGETQYVFYNGRDGKLYHNTFADEAGYGGEGWAGWEDVSGEYEFDYAPYANTYEDRVYLYGVDTTGTLYAKYWADGKWSAWEAVNGGYPAAEAYQPYGVEWGGSNNVFWTGADGKVYWNRYDGTEWTGAKALPYEAEEYEYASAPYAIGYSGDDKLYAYAITADGAPNWNVFDGEGWSGWRAYEAELPAKAEGQPNAYEYDGRQHLVVTGADGHAYSTTYDGAYGEWTDLGDNYAYDPVQVEYDGGLYLTYTGEDDYVHYKEYAAGAEDESYHAEYAEPTPDDDY